MKFTDWVENKEKANEAIGGQPYNLQPGDRQAFYPNKQSVPPKPSDQVLDLMQRGLWQKASQLYYQQNGGLNRPMQWANGATS